MNFKSFRPYFFSFIVFLSAAIYITYPLIFHLSDSATGYGDEYVISWIMNWVIHSLISNPLTLFDTNTFYPYLNTLAYTDLHLISSSLSIPIVLTTGQPISAINFTLLASLVLLPFGIFVLSYYITKNFIVSIFAGLLLVFSPAMLDKKIHVQVLAIQWIPISIFFFLKYFDNKKISFFVLSMLFFYIQSLNSYMSGYFLAIFYLVFATYYWFVDRPKLKALINKKVFLTIIIFVLLLLPFVVPYLKVSREFNYTRDIRDTIHFALQPEDLFYPSEDTRLGLLLKQISSLNNYPSNAEIKPGYIGLVFSLLAVGAFIYWYKKRKEKKMKIFNLFFYSGILGFVLSFGPFLHFNRLTIHEPFPIPLPYLLFYYLAPGFNGFRNSARFEVMFLVFISIAIAIMMSRIYKKIPYKKIIFTILICLIVLEYKAPLILYPVKQTRDFPAVYKFLNTTPVDSKIVIMPIFNWNMWGAAHEMERQYYSTLAFRKMINGSSGFSPPPWQDLVMDLHKEFPNAKSVNRFKKLGINYILIDVEKYDEGYKRKLESVNSRDVISNLNKNEDLKLVRRVDNFYVYKIRE